MQRLRITDPLGDTIRTDSEGNEIIQEGLTSTLGEDNPFGYDEGNQVLTYNKEFDRSKYDEEQLTFIDKFAEVVNHSKTTNVSIVNYEEKIPLLNDQSLSDFEVNGGTTSDGEHVFIARNPKYKDENDKYSNAAFYTKGVAALHEIGGHVRLRFTQPSLDQVSHETLVEKFETNFRQFYQIGTYTKKRDAKRKGVEVGTPKFLGGKADIHGSIHQRLMWGMIKILFDKRKQ